MNIDYNAVIEILKSFLNNDKTEILGISVGEERQVKDAIRNLLTAYEKEKEKRIFYENRLDNMEQLYVDKDKIKPIQIIDLDGKIHNVYKIEEE